MAASPVELVILYILAGCTLLTVVYLFLKKFFKGLQRVAIEAKRLKLILKAKNVEEAEALLPHSPVKAKAIPLKPKS